MDRDIIGDVHGHADELEWLLARLGYRQRAGTWRHPSRKALFLGDLIDKGPDQMRCLDLVRRMVDGGACDVMMGNHEFNAVAWATRDPGRPDGWARARNASNRRQHGAFLSAVGEEDGPLHRELVAWFSTLPLWVETDGFRAVHACWHPSMQAVMRAWVDDDNVLTPEGLRQALARGSEAYVATEVLLKGLEVDLPPGVSYRDTDGIERRKTRLRWWDRSRETYRASALLDEEMSALIPDDPLPSPARLDYDGEKPVFFGHYWLSGPPIVLSSRMACLDYAVATGGHLAAYTFRGERELVPGHLTWTTPVCDPEPDLVIPAP